MQDFTQDALKAAIDALNEACRLCSVFPYHVNEWQGANWPSTRRVEE